MSSLTTAACRNWKMRQKRGMAPLAQGKSCELAEEKGHSYIRKHRRHLSTLNSPEPIADKIVTAVKLRATTYCFLSVESFDSVIPHPNSTLWEKEDYSFSIHEKGEGNGTPLQYSCLENLMDRETWWATVHGAAKSRTQLKWLNSSSSSWMVLSLGNIIRPNWNFVLLNVKVLFSSLL